MKNRSELAIDCRVVQIEALEKAMSVQSGAAFRALYCLKKELERDLARKEERLEKTREAAE